MELETAQAQARCAVPGELLEVLAAAEAGVVSMPSASRMRGSRAEWAAVVAASQRVVNAACAVQDDAIASLAAIEPDELEDGTEVETHRAAGHVALDAPAIVSGVLDDLRGPRRASGSGRGQDGRRRPDRNRCRDRARRSP